MMEWPAEGVEKNAKWLDYMRMNDGYAFYVFKKKPNSEGGKVVVFYRAGPSPATHSISIERKASERQ